MGWAKTIGVNGFKAGNTGVETSRSVGSVANSAGASSLSLFFPGVERFLRPCFFLLEQNCIKHVAKQQAKQHSTMRTSKVHCQGCKQNPEEADAPTLRLALEAEAEFIKGLLAWAETLALMPWEKLRAVQTVSCAPILLRSPTSWLIVPASMTTDWFLAKPTELATCSVTWPFCVTEVRVVAGFALEQVLNQPAEPEFTDASDAEDPPDDPNDPADEDPADVEIGNVVETTCFALAWGGVVVRQGGQAQLTLVDSTARTRAMTRVLILVKRRRGRHKQKTNKP